MRGRQASCNASQARSISGRQARAKSRDDRPADDFAIAFTASKSPSEAIGKPGLDHIDAEAVELMRQTQLLLMVHAATGRLFSVAQGGVENGDADLLSGHDASFSEIVTDVCLYGNGEDHLKQCL